MRETGSMKSGTHPRAAHRNERLRDSDVSASPDRGDNGAGLLFVRKGSFPRFEKL